MIRRAGFRSPVISIVVAALGLGVGLWMIWRGSAIPAFTDQQAAMKAYGEWCSPEAGGASASVGARYFSYWTDKYLWLDSGAGLILSVVTISLLGLGLLIARSGDPLLRTPRRRMTYLAIGGGIVLLLYFGAAQSLVIDLHRLEFPWCADSIGIPLAALSFLTVGSLPVLLGAGYLVTRSFGVLPVGLWRWDETRPSRSWLVSVVCAIVGVSLAILTVSMATTSSYWATPGGIIAIYLIAATRAALLAPGFRPGEPSGDLALG